MTVSRTAAKSKTTATKRRKDTSEPTASLAVLEKLVSQWHPIYNGDKKPQDFTQGSEFNAWSKTSHMACPYCAGNLESIISMFLRMAGGAGHSSLCRVWMQPL